jgi:hypothetical protein
MCTLYFECRYANDDGNQGNCKYVEVYLGKAAEEPYAQRKTEMSRTISRSCSDASITCSDVRIVLQSTKSAKAGDELFVKYGKRYRDRFTITYPTSDPT